jgi:membrane-bound lytic murein transglycosylase
MLDADQKRRPDMARLFLVLSFATLAACADEDQYPVTGENCSPGDPVQEMDASDFDCELNS